MSTKEIAIPSESCITNLEQITPLQSFQTSEVGKNATQLWNEREKTSGLIFKIIIGIGAAIGIIAWISEGSIIEGALSGLLIFGMGYIVYWIYKKFFLNSAIDGYFDKRWNWSIDTAKQVSLWLNSYYYAFYNGYILFYSDKGCAYVNIENGEWIGIDKKDIKRVNLEHVHLGSTTVSESHTTGGATAWSSSYASINTRTSTTHSTTTHYEWRLDIMSGFFNYPNLTVVFADDKEAEDYAKKACALLTP